MKTKNALCGLLLGLLLLAAGNSKAQSTIYYNYTGVLSFEGSPPSQGPDALGLNGASFDLVVSSDADAPPTISNGVNADGYETGTTVALTLAGTVGGTYNGTFTPTLDLIYEYPIGILLCGSSFNLGSYDLQVGEIFLPNGFTGTIPSSDPLTPFTPSDVTGYQGWNAGDGNPNDTALYNVTGGSASGVVVAPEPTTFALAGLGGLASLVAFRRRK